MAALEIPEIGVDAVFADTLIPQTLSILPGCALFAD